MRLLALIPLLFLASCVLVNQDDTQANAQPHSSVMPAVVVSSFAATDAQFADRAQRAGADADSAGDASAEQTATAVPTVSIPLTGASPGAVAGAANAFLHGEAGGDGSLLQEAVDADAAGAALLEENWIDEPAQNADEEEGDDSDD